MKITKLSQIKKLVQTQVRMNSDLLEIKTEAGEIVFVNNLELDELVFDANHDVLKDFAFAYEGKTYTTNEDGGIVLIMDIEASVVIDEAGVAEAIEGTIEVVEESLIENTLAALIQFAKSKTKMEVELKQFETTEGFIVSTDELELGHIVYDEAGEPFAGKTFRIADKNYVTGEFGEIVEITDAVEIVEEIVELKKELAKMKSLYNKQVTKTVGVNTGAVNSTAHPAMSRISKIKSLK